MRMCGHHKSPGGRESQNHKNNFLKEYKFYNNSLNLGKMAVRSRTIGDVDKCKYFRRPITPFVLPKIPTTFSHYSEHQIPSEILQSAERRSCVTSPEVAPQKDVETQTDYRESEAQTEPWEPPYKIAPGHNPEVLMLAHLSWQHGLPAGIHEVRVINRMRIRKAWEAVLPPMDTPTNVKMRSSIITVLDIDEWAFRESEIQFIMDLRLGLMKDLSLNRELEYKKKMEGHFGRLQEKLGKRRDDQVKIIRRDLERNLRKLRRKHQDKQRPCKPDVIQQHADPTSDLYAPQMRFGVHPGRLHEMLQKQFLSESYFEPQEDEEEDTTLNWLPVIEGPKVSKRDVSKPADICIRETRWTEEKLKQLHADLKAIRLNVKSTETVSRLMKRNYKPPTMPVTPRRPGVWDSEQQQREESTTFIQKIIRGRATQSLMYEGRDRCRELIEELQSTQALERHGQQERRDEKIHMIELQRLQNYKSLQEDRLCEILNSLEGRTVCGTLDFLSKELMRLQDERKAHAFALLAERKRCMREAAEAGKRQMERNRRREFDEMFKQIIKVNQDSVEAYLEDIITEGIDWISDKTAKEHVLELCDKVDAASKYAFENANNLAEEELIADMIHNFVLPEVEQHNARRKIRNQQQNYIRNAHISIYEKILDLPSVESSQIMNQENCIRNEEMSMIYMDDTEQDNKTKKVESPIHQIDIEESTDIVCSLLNFIIENVIGSANL